MPKNKGKGGKNENDNVKRELILKDDGQSYAQVTRILGNGHIEAFCFDSTGGKKRLCHIRGKLRKKVWINQGDVILVGLRDYQDDKADVIMKYLSDEARELKRIREIPDNVNITETSTSNNEGLEDVVFDERHNSDQSGDEKALPHNTANHIGSYGSLSEGESDEDEDDGNNFYDSTRMPKKIGQSYAHNNRREIISGSDSATKDELAHI